MKKQTTIKRVTLATIVAAISGFTASTLSAASFTWDGQPDVPPGTSPDNLVTTGTNWIGDVAPSLVAPGDDWFFGNSAFTSVATPTAGGRVNSITFNSDAPSYTIAGTNTGGSDLAFPNITNLSPNVQTINDGLNLQAATIKSTNGALVFGGQYVYNNGSVSNTANRAATSTKYWVTQDITLNAPLWRAAYLNVYGPNGTATTVSDMTGVTGALILNSATGTANSNTDGNFTGQVNIWSGAVRVGNSTALGYTGTGSASNTFIHGTFANSTATVGQTSGSSDFGFGRLEVYNNITLTESLRIDSRVGDAADFDHLVNYSGDNTVNPTALAIGGGGHFNFSSTTGTLTLGSNFNVHVSDPNHQTGGVAVNNVFTFRGAGNIVVNGAFQKADTGLGLTTFRKQGGGTVTLGNATNNWDGGTLVEAGTLTVATAGALAMDGAIIHVASPGTLDVTVGGLSLASGKTLSGNGNIVGNVTLSGGGISPGGIGSLSTTDALVVTNSVGNLHLGNNLTLNDTSSLKFDLANSSGGSNDLVSVAGNLTLNGTTTFNISAPSGLGTGSYELIHYNGSLTDNGSTLNLSGVSSGPRQTIGVSTTTAHSVDLVVTGNAANLTWVGNGGTNAWQTNGPDANNWTGATGVTPDNHFYDGDFVTFGNSMNTSVNVVGTVAPGGISFTNMTNNYSLGGSGTVNTPGNLTISGTGGVTFGHSGGTTVNSFTNNNAATFTLSNGTLATAGNFTNSGSGNVVISGGSLLVGGSLIQSGTGTTTISNSNSTNGIAGGITIAAGGTIALNRTDDLTLNIPTNGAGTFRKQNTNTLTVSANNTAFTGNTIVESGKLILANPNALGALTASTTVQNGAAVDLNGQIAINANVIIEGNGPDGNGALINTSQVAFAQINGITLSNDATMSVGVSGALKRSITFVNSFIHGQGHSLNVNMIDDATNEVDFIDVGETGLANFNVNTNIPGGSLYIGGTTTLGNAPGTFTVSGGAKIGFYAAAAGVTHTKPIVIDASSGGLEVDMGNHNANNFSNLTIASPITMNGPTVIDQYRPSNTIVRSMTLSGKLSGSGAVDFHTNSSGGNNAAIGIIQLTSDLNDFNGPINIGGGFGVDAGSVPAYDDRVIVSIGDGGTTGQFGTTTQSITLNASSATVNNVLHTGISTLRFNRSNTLTIANNLQGVGGGIEQFGTGITTLTGTNTYTGTTTVTHGTLEFAKEVSLYNNTSASWIDTNIIVNSGATAAFNVGGAGEFLDTDIQTISAIGTGTGGFLPGSSIGFDTTNAGGTFTYAPAISNTNAGANSIGVTKLGTGTLVLSNTNTYTGNTTVSAGTLNITGSHTTGANYIVNSGANLITNNVLVTNGLTVNGTTTINANGGAAGTSKVETLTLGPSGKLNLKNNDLVVGTGSVLTVRSLIKAGLSGTSNTAAATGITSDMMTVGKHGFGYAAGNDPNLSPALGGSLSGQAYDADSVLVKYTYLGDADLDGDVDVNDFSLWASNFTGSLNPLSPPTKFWTQGDFDYDGDVDVNDFSLWASNFTGSLTIGGPGSLIVNGASLSVSSGVVSTLEGLGVTVVPEPSTIGLFGLGLGTIGFYGLRKKRVKAQC